MEQPTDFKVKGNKYEVCHLKVPYIVLVNHLGNVLEVRCMYV